MAELSTRFAHAPGGRVLAALVAVALGSASIGVSSVAFAQPKPATGAAAKPAAGGAKPAAGAKPATAKGPTAADKKKAGEHFKKGKELFDKKDYKGAKEQFSKAEELIPAGTAEYYIGRCQEELGDSADAASWYDKALAGKLKPELETDAKSREDALKAKPAKVKVTSDPPGATILVDGKDTGMKTPADVDVAPGSHKITLQATGKKDNEQTVEVAAFTGASVNATLEAGAAAEDPFATKDTGTTAATTTPTTTATTTTTATATVTPDTGGGKRDMTWVYVTGAAAIVGLGVGTFFGIKALSDKKDFDNATSSGDRQTSLDVRDRGTRDALISDMGFGIGITLAVTSAVLYFSGGSSSSSEGAPAASKKPSVAFAPIVSGIGSGSGPSMAGAAAAFSF